MANLQNNDILFGDDDRGGMALFMADFENFQHDNQQVLCNLQIEITRLMLKITQICGDSRNRNDGQHAHCDRVPSQPICKRVLGRKKIKEYKDIPNYTALFYKEIFLEWLLDLDRIFY